MLTSTKVLTGGDVGSRVREKERERKREKERERKKREQSAKINYSTHGWRCSLKIENKSLRSTTVVTGGGVDSRERTKC